MRSELCILTTAIGLYLLSLAGVLLQPNSSDAGQTNPPSQTKPVPKQLGFSLNLHHTEHLPLYFDSIDELEKLGFKSLQVLTPAFQRDGAAERIEIVAEPGRCPTRRDLIDLLRYARRQGMHTTLMPTVLFTKPRGNEWRGRISPENWDNWWASYNDMIDYFLDIANEADVQMFCIGSELLSTEKHTRRWKKLIADIRSKFDGHLIYSTNWDHFHVPGFWEDLDLIGVSGYWNLTQGAANNPPTDAELAARWASIQSGVMEFAKEKDRPILITELGYPSLTWALKDPWNYVKGTDGQMDSTPQARGYESFLKAWAGPLKASNSRFAGVYFYCWDPYHHGGSEDTGYGIRGKPAYDLLRQWMKTNYPGSGY